MIAVMHYSNVGFVYHLRDRDVGQDNRCSVKCGRHRCAVKIIISNSNDGREWSNAHCHFKQCTGCFEISYCSRECKYLDWVDHKRCCRYWRSVKRRSKCPISSVVDYNDDSILKRSDNKHCRRCTCGSDSCR